MDEESFTLLDDTRIAELIPQTFNEETMEQKTLLQAVDLFCKLFFVYDINYPKPFAPIREFLQHSL